MPEQLAGVRRTRVAAIDVMALREAEVVDAVADGWRAGAGGSVVTANVDITRAAARRPDLAALVASSDIVVADGMPIVWASRLAGGPVPERVTGSSLVYSLTERASELGEAVYLIGGEPGVPESAADQLGRRFPGLKVAGAESPLFGFERSPEAVGAIVDRVSAADPGLVLVGLGFPKQERLIELLRDAHPRAWYLGCGAGIAMAAGQFRRAPAAVQQLGAEWVHRLVLEPRRLARRYLRDDAPYALGLLAAAACRGAVARTGRRRPPTGGDGGTAT